MPSSSKRNRLSPSKGAAYSRFTLCPEKAALNKLNRTRKIIVLFFYRREIASDSTGSIRSSRRRQKSLGGDYNQPAAKRTARKTLNDCCSADKNAQALQSISSEKNRRHACVLLSGTTLAHYALD